jgi:hypothetical protein
MSGIDCLLWDGRITDLVKSQWPSPDYPKKYGRFKVCPGSAITGIATISHHHAGRIATGFMDDSMAFKKPSLSNTFVVEPLNMNVSEVYQ